MSESNWLHYVWSCGLLIVPILLWNVLFYRYLPPAFATNEFERDIPPLVMYGRTACDSRFLSCRS